MQRVTDGQSHRQTDRQTDIYTMVSTATELHSPVYISTLNQETSELTLHFTDFWSTLAEIFQLLNYYIGLVHLPFSSYDHGFSRLRILERDKHVSYVDENQLLLSPDLKLLPNTAVGLPSVCRWAAARRRIIVPCRRFHTQVVRITTIGVPVRRSSKMWDGVNTESNSQHDESGTNPHWPTKIGTQVANHQQRRCSSDLVGGRYPCGLTTG